SIDTPGTYRGQCSQICGKEHGYMPIVVIAKSADDYAKWLADEKAKMPKPEVVVAAAPEPAAAAPAAGEKGAAAGPAKPADGKSVYETTCFACHGTGAAGAPKFGDKAAWAPRIKEGKDVMYGVALKGKGAMPPRGGNTTLSDDQVKAAVDYMAAAAK